MDRMTGRNEKGDLLFMGEQVYAGQLYEVVSILEEYEDIGLTPEQLLEIDKLYSDMCREVAELRKQLSEKTTAYDVDKVVGELEEKLERYYYLYHDQHVDSTYNEGRADGMQKAIGIVKAGGVDE